MICIYLAECFIIATLVYTLSGLFFDICLKKVVSDVMKDINTMYSLKIYAVVYALYIAVSIVLLLVVIYRVVRVQIRNLVLEG